MGSARKGVERVGPSHVTEKKVRLRGSSGAQGGQTFLKSLSQSFVFNLVSPLLGTDLRETKRCPHKDR